MKMTIKKWGNSQGLRFSKEILDQLKLKVDDEVNVEVVQNKIIITKAHPEKVDIRKLFAEYNEDFKGEEFDWGKVNGEEIW